MSSRNKYPPLGDEYNAETLFKYLADLFYCKDKEAWHVQVNDQNFKQSRCFPDNSDVVMFKCQQRFNADVRSIVSVVLDHRNRSQWDTKIVDWKLFYGTSDNSYGRYYFYFSSPAKPLVADRDFYLL